MPILLLLAMVMSGCTTLGPAPAPLATHLTGQDDAGACSRYFATLDQAVHSAGVEDLQARHIPGFPYLRVNRFLASFADQSLAGPALTAWLDRMMELDREARKAEIANLPDSLRLELHGPKGTTDLPQEVRRCGDRLRQIDLVVPENLRRLRDRAYVPDNYSTTKSIIGLYPLTALFVRLGIANYHREIMESYRSDLAGLSVSGHLVRYVPPAAGPPDVAGAEALVAQAPPDPLGVPQFDSEERNRLLLAFAPIWEIDDTGDYDRPGTPTWNETLPAVDTRQPRVYTLVSHTRFQGEILLQLNYVIWFAERPRQGVFDIFSGRLDGLIWRVTLDRHGAPLVYDTIHNCGCYHMFFPGADLTVRQPETFFNEPLLIPQQKIAPAGNRRLIIRVATGTHYIDRIYTGRESAATATVTYTLADYDALRSLPTGNDGRRSLFGPDGLVPGTERGERWLLWPTGVAAPGAMRQWGNHATAFFGRRHFDDPDLLERLFMPAKPAAP